VRYYTYISEAKLDQLYSQVPRKVLSRLAGELHIDAKIASMSVRNVEADLSTFDRLRLVERYIDEHCETGWFTEPRGWFRGELDLRWAIVRRFGAVVHTGLDHDTVLAMVGSARHLVGQAKPVPGSELDTPASDLPALLGIVERHVEDYRAMPFGAHGPTDRGWPFAGRYGPDEEEQEALEQVLYFSRGMRGPRQPCQFLARRLLQGHTTGPDGQSVNVVIGTPLYVALSDE